MEAKSHPRRLRQIRLAGETDAAAVQAIYAPVVASSSASFELQPPTVEQMADRIRSVYPTHAWLLLTEGDEALGFAYSHRFSDRPAYRWSVETSIYVDAHARRSGVGLALYRSLLRLCLGQGFRQAAAGITLPNPASVALHEAVGFRLVGVYRQIGWKMGSWHDVGWWQRPLGANADPPDEPADVRDLPPDILREALEAGLTED